MHRIKVKIVDIHIRAVLLDDEDLLARFQYLVEFPCRELIKMFNEKSHAFSPPHQMIANNLTHMRVICIFSVE